MRIFVDDWRRIGVLSWAFWFGFFGLALFLGSEFAFALWGIEVNPYFVGNATLGFYFLSMALRFVRQPRGALASWAITIVLAVAVLAVSSAMAAAQGFRADTPAGERATLNEAVPLVLKWEGLELTAYLDTIASPPVWTICAGDTRSVVQGMVKTRAECLDSLRAGLADYRRGLHRYFQPVTKAAHLTPKRDAAFVSLAWNIGIGAAGKSTATRRLNAGDIAGACNALTWFNKAGGRVVRGLVNRRGDEYAYCIAGAV